MIFRRIKRRLMSLVLDKPQPRYVVCDFGMVKELDRLMLDQLLTELKGAVLIAEEKPLPEEYNPTEEKR